MASPHDLGPADVAVVVPVGGQAPSWGRCARSLARLDPGPAEIVVVIDGPNDTASSLAAGIGATAVQLEKRSGPAKARNLGVQTTEADLLLFIDSDIEVPKDLVAAVAAVFSAEPETSAVIGSYDESPGDPAFLSQYRNLLHHFVHQKGRERASTFWAGCGAIRRRAFEEIGGFDEDYPVPSIEDIELGSRLLRSGHAIRLRKDLQVKHLKEWRLVDLLRTDLLRRAVPWTELMQREGRMVNDLNVKTRDRLSVVLAFIPLLVLPAAWLWPKLWGVSVAALVFIGFLNAGLLGFFLSRRGALFTLRAIPMYWAYLLICGFGFALGFLRHRLGRST